MTDFPQALGWLNQFDDPHISLASTLYLGTALDPDAPEADRVEAFNRLLEIAEVSDRSSGISRSAGIASGLSLFPGQLCHCTFGVQFCI